MVLLVFLLGGCTEKETKKPLIISTDTWMGASLLYYAHYKGWLEANGIQMLQTSSINENMRVFESGASDLFTGTQHEYKRQLKTSPDLVPIIIYDRSYGGDIIMSNRTKEELQNGHQTIKVFLERESVSEELLDYFIELNQIDRNQLQIYNRSQNELVSLKNTSDDTPMIIVTYSPHDLKLSQNGFRQIVSSREDGYYVIDAVYASKKILNTRSEAIRDLKKVLKDSFEAYTKNPKEFYEVVKPYLGNPTYEEFTDMRKNIKWMGEVADPKITEWMDKIEFPTENLVE